MQACNNLTPSTAETRTDNIWWQAHTHEDLATVLERAGRTDEARDAFERALAIWEQKQCLPCAERVLAQIDSLRERDRATLNQTDPLL